jgi:hypothetical protein
MMVGGGANRKGMEGGGGDPLFSTGTEEQFALSQELSIEVALSLKKLTLASHYLKT